MKNALSTNQAIQGTDHTLQNYTTEADRLRGAVRFCDSYTRLPTMLSLYPSRNKSAWFEVLGEEWSMSDNIGIYKDALCKILRGAGRPLLNLMMDESDRQTFGTLPDEITVYRGCYPLNMDGLSWSLSKDVAARFPKLARYRRTDSQPLLLTGKVSKSDCILMLGRCEQEIVSCKVKLLNTEALP